MNDQERIDDYPVQGNNPNRRANTDGNNYDINMFSNNSMNLGGPSVKDFPKSKNSKKKITTFSMK